MEVEREGEGRESEGEGGREGRREGGEFACTLLLRSLEFMFHLSLVATWCTSFVILQELRMEFQGSDNTEGLYSRLNGPFAQVINSK